LLISYYRRLKNKKMNLFTIITAVIVISVVWGGLAFFLSRALKYEKMKLKNGEE
jgi:predicted permease